MEIFPNSSYSAAGDQQIIQTVTNQTNTPSVGPADGATLDDLCADVSALLTLSFCFDVPVLLPNDRRAASEEPYLEDAAVRKSEVYEPPRPLLGLTTEYRATISIYLLLARQLVSR